MKERTSPVNAWKMLLMAVFVGLVLSSVVFGQDGGRKVRNRVSPVYPELARKVNASGTVRLEIQIAPSGDVKTIKALGGHPLLIPAAEDAIKKWKYEPGSDATTTIVEFRFNAG